MNLREFLSSVSDLYDSNAPFDSPGQEALVAGAPVLAARIPAGLLVKFGGGKGKTTITPWIGVLDPDETATPQSGIYFVYIFSADLDVVALTLIQGTDVGHHKSSLSRSALRSDSAAIRAAMSHNKLDEFPPHLDLGTNNSRQQRYKAGAIATKTYRINSLPEEETLMKDLHSMLSLYTEAIDAKRRLLLSVPGSIHASGLPRQTHGFDLYRDFKPKDDSDYQQTIAGKTIRKSRSHETLIQEFGKFAIEKNLNPATNVHPRDLTLMRFGEHWLVEAKTVGSQPANAVRAAIGQLFEYDYMLYPVESKPRKLALFSESVGFGFVEMMESVGIASIWKEKGIWTGSVSAQSLLAS